MSFEKRVFVGDESGNMEEIKFTQVSETDKIAGRLDDLHKRFAPEEGIGESKTKEDKPKSTRDELSDMAKKSFEGTVFKETK